MPEPSALTQHLDMARLLRDIQDLPTVCGVSWDNTVFEVSVFSTLREMLKQSGLAVDIATCACHAAKELPLFDGDAHLTHATALLFRGQLFGMDGPTTEEGLRQSAARLMREATKHEICPAQETYRISYSKGLAQILKNTHPAVERRLSEVVSEHLAFCNQKVLEAQTGLSGSTAPRARI